MNTLSPNVQTQLETTTRQFLDGNQAFTAMDVTYETRQREKIFLRHGDARGAIHAIQCLQDALDFGHESDNGQTIEWKKTLCPIGPNNQGVFVYHPVSFDPNNYQPRQVGSTTVVNSISQATSDSSQVSDAGGDNGDGTFTTDCRRRLLVQSRFMRELGLKAKEHVFVAIESNKILLMNSTVAASYQGNTTSILLLERNGNLYLSSKSLGEAGFVTSNKFKVEVVDNNGNKVVEVVEA